MPSLSRLAEDLAAFRTTSRALVEGCLERAQRADGEGQRVFLKLRASEARATAERIDRDRRAGLSVPKYAGIPISIKDLFDIAGDVTTAGSTLLRDAAPATQDATSVERLRAAGFIPMGRTNMTEFAFSGLGLNCHYGTPANPFDRQTRRIPGGSSSGAAVSITDAMAFAALGTDTGGSCRIPAALCGIVGFKPTQRRVPLDGAFPLSPSLDSIGPLANSVKCCAVLDAILAGESASDLSPIGLKGLRIAAPQSFVLDELEPAVASAYSRALTRLSSAGVHIIDIALNELRELPQLNSKGGLAPPEALAIHREWITQRPDAYDPRVRARILRGAEQDAADYIQLLSRRRDFATRVAGLLRDFDAVIMPTVPMIAPPLDALTDDGAYSRANMLALRNPSVINFIDGCAISIPCHALGEAPVGLMIAALHGNDRRLLAIAMTIETLISPCVDAVNP